MPDAIPPEVTALDQSEESAMAALYRAAVGEINAAAYAKVFATYETADGAGPGWNWAAALCTLNWMLFRKLWGAALAYAGAIVGGALLLFGIGRLIFQFSADIEQALLAASIALAFIVPGVFGNAIFYHACRKRIEQALAAHTTLPEACAMLQRDAATRRRMVMLAGLNAVLVAGAFAAYTSVPSLDSLTVHRVAEPAPAPQPLASASSALPPHTAAGRVTPASAPPPVVSASVPASAPAIAASVPASVPAIASAAVAASVPASVPKPALAPASAPGPTIIVTKPPPPAVKPSTAPPAAAASKTGKTFAINVGLFADENNARNALAKLTDAGLPATKQEVRGPRGRFQRVRVGPFETRAEADAAADKVQALGLEAIVFQP